MRYFPVFLDLDDKTVIVAGGGAVAANKLVLFAKSNARLICIAEDFNDEILALSASGRVELDRQAPEQASFDGALIVIAATESDADAIIAARAREAGALVNAVDKTELCSFITPSIVNRGQIRVAIGTEGSAPVLARRLREQVERLLPENLGDLAAFIGANRARIAEILPQTPQRRAFWERVVDGDIGALVLTGELLRAQIGLEQALAAYAANPDALKQPSRVTLLTSPAAPDDLTLRALRAMQDADILIASSRVPASVLDKARRDAERVQAGDIDELIRLATKRAQNAFCLRLVVLFPPDFVEDDARRVVGKLEEAGVAVESLSNSFTTPSHKTTEKPLPVKKMAFFGVIKRTIFSVFKP